MEWNELNILIFSCLSVLFACCCLWFLYLLNSQTKFCCCFLQYNQHINRKKARNLLPFCCQFLRLQKKAKKKEGKVKRIEKSIKMQIVGIADRKKKNQDSTWMKSNILNFSRSQQQSLIVVSKQDRQKTYCVVSFVIIKYVIHSRKVSMYVCSIRMYVGYSQQNILK